MYIEPAAFKPINTFPAELTSGRFQKLTDRLAKEPIALILPDGRSVVGDSAIDRIWYGMKRPKLGTANGSRSLFPLSRNGSMRQH